MAFTMSYGATPSPPPAESPPKATVRKTSVASRGRKHSDLRAQAQAVFDPALAQTSDASSPSVATEAPADSAAPPSQAEELAPAPGAHDRLPPT